MRKFLLLLIGLSWSCSQNAPRSAKESKTNPPRILLFYADKLQVAKGEEVLVCYGVEGATSVRLDPPIEQITPSFNRCFKYAPATTREYALVATAADGTTARQSFTVRVEGVAAPPAESRLIGRFSANQSEIDAGQSVTLCFDAVNADEVTLDPPSRFPGGQLGCFSVVPSATTKYTLRARKGAIRDSRTLVIKVRGGV